MDNIFAAFPKIFDAIKTDPNARGAFVFAAWRQSVGELLNEQTVPVEFSDSKLRIAVSSQTWKQHLEDMADQMLARLNLKLGTLSVRFLEFVVNEAAVNANRPVQRVAPERKKDLTAYGIASDLRASALAIENEELREAFLLAAGSCLERTSRMMKTR